MKRTYLLPFAFALVVVTAGCLGLLGGVSEERECAGADYDFATDANATYTIQTNGTYNAVYNITNATTVEFFQSDGLGNNQPLQLSAVQFRANDTTYDCDDIEVETTRRKTIVTLPEANGTFAYRTGSSPKRFVTRKFIDGSHEVILPPDRSISNPLFGSVQPGGFNTSTDADSRVHIEWGNVRTNSISVQYYMNRDIPLFFGVVGVGALLAIGGLAYYYRLVQNLRRKREEAGLDMEEEVEDDSGRDPPPGF